MLSADSIRLHRSRSRGHPGGGLLLGLAGGGSRIRTFRPFRDQCLSELVDPCAELHVAPERSFSVAGPIVRVHLRPAVNQPNKALSRRPTQKGAARQ